MWLQRREISSIKKNLKKNNKSNDEQVRRREVEGALNRIYAVKLEFPDINKFYSVLSFDSN